MLRKHRLTTPLPTPESQLEEIDLAATATVYLSSEDEAHPVEDAFDQQRGPGGSRWSAADPGEQTLLLVFDRPQAIRRIRLAVEERAVSRTQELHLAASRDGGQTFQEVVRQEYTFSPPGTTFEHEEWAVVLDGVTHLRLWIKPDKGGQPYKATLTSLVLQGTGP